jgi:uncharacterized protein
MKEAIHGPSSLQGLSDLIDYFRSEGISTCLLYGSAASGSIRSDSDIDLAIAGADLLGAEELSRYYLKAVSLLHREVDLRDLRRAKGLYLKEILAMGRILLNEDPGFLGNKAIEMMDYQTDLAPQINRIRLQLLQRKLYDQ